MSDFDKTLHAQLRHLIDDLTVAVDDDGHTRYAPKNTLMFSNFIGALIELMPTLAARAQPAQAVPITSETGNQAAQGASGITSGSVPLLSEQEVVKCLTASGCVGTIKMSYDSGPYEITRTSINADRFARAVEAAVRAKLGVAVPMTDPQLQTSEERRATGERIMALATNELSDLVRRARAIVVGHQRGSISLVQRHLRISYNTAAKLLEALEQQGVVSPQRQNGQREVLVLPDISGIVGKEGA